MSLGVAVALARNSPHLGAMIRSLRGFGTDIEITVADASGDPAVRTAFSALGSRVARYFAEPDAGQSDGLIKALAALESPFVGWLNDDDFLVAGAAVPIERALANADLVHGEALFFDEAGAAIGYHPNVAADPGALTLQNSIAQPGCFFRRDLYRDIGGVRRDLHFVMDWDLWLRMRYAGARLAHLPRLVSGVTMARATKTSQLAGQRFAEVATVARAAGQGRALAFVHGLRVLAGAARWSVQTGATPAQPFFRRWAQAGGEARAPLAGEADLQVFHTHAGTVSRASLAALDDGADTQIMLTESAPPFTPFALPVPMAVSAIRRIAFTGDPSA